LSTARPTEIRACTPVRALLSALYTENILLLHSISDTGKLSETARSIADQ
jgi:hypothetical protein